MFDWRRFNGPAAGFVALAWMGLCTSAAGQPPAAAQWWNVEPIRFLQTNLTERDSTVDPVKLVEAVDEFGANTYLLNMGGICAQYPTQVPLHYPSLFLPPGKDLFGDALTEAHKRGIRVIGRFDLSKTPKAVYDERPEWFFVDAKGEPAVFAGLYATCINGGYYREHAMTILTEALEKYPVDGLFFNMFGNPSRDYAGRYLGPCQCAACREKYQSRFGSPIPMQENDDYRRFMSDSNREVAAAIAKLIHKLRPDAAFMTYIDDETDVLMSEANTSVSRPLPLWPYAASDQVNSGRNSHPGKAAISLNMSFVDYSWRYITVPRPEVTLRLYQQLAQGGPLALVVLGTMDQEDRRSLVAGKPVFAWHAAHEDLYVGQQNAARVLLLKRGDESSYRGFYRLLAEQHIPFAASTRVDAVAEGRRSWDLVIAPDGADESLAPYVEQGGRLLVAGAHRLPESLAVGKLVAERGPTQGAWRIQRPELFPSLGDTNLLILNGQYVELEPQSDPALTLIPPAMIGPPEKVWADKVETTVPGVAWGDVGEGHVTYVPWDVGGMYYRHGSEGHAGLMADLVDRLLPDGRQLRSTAHPLVEMTVMRQPALGRTLVHLVNMSGHTDVAYHRPIPMQNIAIELRGEYATARAMRADRELPIAREGESAKLTLPALDAYEVIVLEEAGQ